MQHVEFFNKEHFERHYHRITPPASLAYFIDFFWQTKFENIWGQFPEGFSDILFPNIGYTYLLNLGTPFVMQVEHDKYPINKDSFLPRHKSIECFHQRGNVIFGIKFKISPILLEKKVNFSEYKGTMSPLSYLINRKVIDDVKEANQFEQRVAILITYFESIVQSSEGSLKPVSIVTEILNTCNSKNDFSVSVEKLAVRYDISTRTLQRYFEITTSLSSKQTLQILRVRKAAAHLAGDPASFDHKIYGYYDYSHFYKHLRRFLQHAVLDNLQKDFLKRNKNGSLA